MCGDMCDRIHKQGHSDLHASGDTIAHYSMSMPMYVHSHDETPTIPKALYIGRVGTYPIMHHAFAPLQSKHTPITASRADVW